MNSIQPNLDLDFFKLDLDQFSFKLDLNKIFSLKSCWICLKLGLNYHPYQ